MEDKDGNWEDPRKPKNGFTRGQNMQDLLKKAKTNAASEPKAAAQGRKRAASSGGQGDKAGNEVSCKARL